MQFWIPGSRRTGAPRNDEVSEYDGRDVFNAWHLELAGVRPAADGARTDAARRLPVLGRARGIAGRAVVVRDRAAVAAAAVDVCGVRRRRGAGMAPGGAKQFRRQ